MPLARRWTLTAVLACAHGLAVTSIQGQVDSATRRTDSTAGWRVMVIERRDPASTAVIAFLYADRPREAATDDARIVVRCQQQRLEAFVMLRAPARAADSAVARVRTSWSDAHEGDDLWPISDDGLAIFAPNPLSFIGSGLLRHARLTVEVQHDTGAAAQAQVRYAFGVAGLDAHLGDLRDACATAWARMVTARATEDRVRSYYLESEVDRRVEQIPGTIALRYPNDMRSQGVEGEVVAEYVVGSSGRVVASTIRFRRSTHPAFTEAVRIALQTAQHHPAEVGGKPVAQLVQMPFSFTLTR